MRLLICSSSDDESNGLIFSPVKPKLGSSLSDESSSSEFDIRQIIPDVCNDYHDPEMKTLPILAQPSQGLIGTVPADRICSRKPTSVRYGSVFIVDLSCVKSILDLRADDNGVWLHGGKPRGKYHPVTSELNVVQLDKKLVTETKNVFTLVRI